MCVIVAVFVFVNECRGGSEPYSDDRGGGRGRGRGNNTRWREGKLALLCVILLIFECCSICYFHLLQLNGMDYELLA